MNNKILRVKHSGRLGDIIYSYMAIANYAIENGLDIEFALWDNPALKNLSDEGHLYPGGINDEAYDFIKPWLESVGCSVIKYEGQKCVDLDIIKHMGKMICLPYSDIRKWYQYAYPEFNLGIHLSTPSKNPRPYDFIVVNRTRRWQNIHIDYTFMRGLKNRIIFIGTEDEYSEFSEMVPNSEFFAYQSKVRANILEIEAMIKDCKVFVGNQSMFYALAEYNQVPRMLEVCDYAPNVISMGVNNHDFVTQQGFEYLITKLCH
jgi:hypothetical protein